MWLSCNPTKTSRLLRQSLNLLPPSPQYQPPPSPLELAQDQVAPMPSSLHIREPKIATPLPFSEKSDDTESFINRCCLYMNGRKLKFPDEDAKIYWILLYMQTGSAKTWHNYIVALMYKGQQSFCYNFSSELLLHTFYSWLRLNRSDSLHMTHLLQAQSAHSPFRLFFSRLLSFTDCDMLYLTHNP